MIAQVIIRDYNPKDKRIKRKMFTLTLEENNVYKNIFDIPVKDAIGNLDAISIIFAVKRENGRGDK